MASDLGIKFIAERDAIFTNRPILPALIPNFSLAQEIVPSTVGESRTQSCLSRWEKDGGTKNPLKCSDNPTILFASRRMPKVFRPIRDLL